ncbi:hypothetical protein WKY82_20275 [Gordonia malaquae]|uniref:hypothetical protein n=1 Tax=Gordonia malaquae TaxID=410332 RepID=UPI00301705A3
MTATLTAPDGVDSLLTAAEASALARVSAISVRNWANRGYRGVDGQWHRLPVSGKDRQGRNLYKLIDVAKAERATRARARRSH